MSLFRVLYGEGLDIIIMYLVPTTPGRSSSLNRQKGVLHNFPFEEEHSSASALIWPRSIGCTSIVGMHCLLDCRSRRTHPMAAACSRSAGVPANFCPHLRDPDLDTGSPVCTAVQGDKASFSRCYHPKPPVLGFHLRHAPPVCRARDAALNAAFPCTRHGMSCHPTTKVLSTFSFIFSTTTVSPLLAKIERHVIKSTPSTIP